MSTSMKHYSKLSDLMSFIKHSNDSETHFILFIAQLCDREKRYTSYTVTLSRYNEIC